MGTVDSLTKITLHGFLLTAGYTEHLPDLAFHEGIQLWEAVNPQLSLDSSSGQDSRMECLCPG